MTEIATELIRATAILVKLTTARQTAIVENPLGLHRGSVNRIQQFQIQFMYKNDLS